MIELYLLTRICALSNLALAIIAVSVILTVVFWILVLDTDEGSKKFRLFKKLAKRSSITAAVTLILYFFIPDKKELYFIIGVGGVVDYVQQNDTLKQIPDKCIEALDKWVEEQIKEE